MCMQVSFKKAAVHTKNINYETSLQSSQGWSLTNNDSLVKRTTIETDLIIVLQETLKKC